MNWYRKLKQADSPLPSYEYPEDVQIDPHIDEDRPGVDDVDSRMTAEDAYRMEQKYPGLVFIGAGAFGVAFAHNDNVVIKLTTDGSEYLSAMDILGMQKSKGGILGKGQIPGLVNVINAEELQNGVYAIVSDKLEHLNPQEQKFVDLMFNQKYNMCELEIPDDVMLEVMERHIEEEEKFEGHNRFEGIDIRSPEFIYVYHKYKKMLIDLCAVDANFSDAHEYNVGKLPNGDYAMFDLGGLF